MPPGTWVDYQGGKSYEGGRWYRIAAGELPVIVLVRGGAVIPRVGLAQSTDRMDWSGVELAVFGTDAPSVEALVCLSEDDALHRLRLERHDGGYVLEGDPFEGEVALALVQPH